MSRDAKIIIFSLILIFSIYNKNVNGGFFESTNDKTTTKTSKSRPKSTSSKSTSSESKFSDYELSETVKNLKKGDYSEEYINKFVSEYKRNWKEEDPTGYSKRTDDYKKYYTEVYNREKRSSNLPKKTSKTNYNSSEDLDYKDKTFTFGGDRYNYNEIKLASEALGLSVKEYTKKYGILVEDKYNNGKLTSTSPKNKEFDIDSPDYTTIPQSGHSPYDAYFGKGIYNDTDNSIVVTAPAKTHVVFVVINTYTKRRIRNEFIRKGETFTMTKIPYGTYDYMYFTGRNWSKNVLINNGTVRGGFKDYQSFNKNEDNKDQMEFERGYYGSYTIRLKQTIGGNLETKSTSEADFFN
jgi:hypothetical protein